MTYHFKINQKRCVLCRYCEVVCALQVKDEFDPEASHIKDLRDEKNIVDEFTCDPPIACLKNPQCADACDQRAIKFNRL